MITDFSGPNDIALCVAIRSDGKIVAAGQAFVSARIAFAVARYNSNGTLDTSFGKGGKTTTSFVGSLVDQAFSVAIQSDGKAVVAGSAEIYQHFELGIKPEFSKPVVSFTGWCRLAYQSVC